MNILKDICVLAESTLFCKNKWQLDLLFPESEIMDTGKKRHVCVVCDKTFAYPSHLAMHLKTHSEERPYMCVTCHAGFKRKDHLINHTMTHTGEKPYLCEICGKNFSTSFHLSRHKETHEKQFLCVVCCAGFEKARDLVNHMGIHTGGKPYLCNCGKTFAKRYQLTNHKKTHNINFEYFYVQ